MKRVSMKGTSIHLRLLLWNWRGRIQDKKRQQRLFRKATAWHQACCLHLRVDQWMRTVLQSAPGMQAKAFDGMERTHKGEEGEGEGGGEGGEGGEGGDSAITERVVAVQRGPGVQAKTLNGMERAHGGGGGGDSALAERFVAVQRGLYAKRLLTRICRAWCFIVFVAVCRARGSSQLAKLRDRQVCADGVSSWHAFVLSARACKVKVYKIEWKAEVRLLRCSCALWRQTQRKEEEEEAAEEEEVVEELASSSSHPLCTAVSQNMTLDEWDLRERIVSGSRECRTRVRGDSQHAEERLLLSAAQQEAQELRCHVANLVVARFVECQGREILPEHPGLQQRSW